MQKVAIDSDTIFLRPELSAFFSRVTLTVAFTRSGETGRRYCLFRLRTRDEYTFV